MLQLKTNVGIVWCKMQVRKEMFCTASRDEEDDNVRLLLSGQLQCVFLKGEVTISTSVPTIKDNTSSILNYKLF